MKPNQPESEKDTLSALAEKSLASDASQEEQKPVSELPETVILPEGDTPEPTEMPAESGTPESTETQPETSAPESAPQPPEPAEMPEPAVQSPEPSLAELVEQTAPPVRGREVQKKKKKKSMAPLVIILGVIVLLIGGSIFFYQFGISAVDKNSNKEIQIEVADQSGALSVLEQLDEAGLIRNKLCAKVHIRLMPPEMIQANTYAFTKSMSLSDMYNAMEIGDPKYLVEAKVTVIEGATIPETAKVISEAFGIPEEEILETWSSESYLRSLMDDYWFLTDRILNKKLLYPLEGYFYPATYPFPSENPTIEEITIAFLDKMDQKLTPYKDQIDSKLGMRVDEFLAFSSVVEAESLFEEDRPKIAGVFINRLNEKMPLQSDITVLYVLGEKRPNVSIAETKIDSPYNTYKNQGLPIGPVCTTQEKTMEDCLNYEKSPYLYFFATKDGKVLYSKTYEEHLKIIEENKWY